MIPALDSRIGITVYSTNFDGIGGIIRVEPEDFQVTELISEKATKSITDQNGYAVYKLKKKKIDTNPPNFQCKKTDKETVPKKSKSPNFTGENRSL